MKNGRSRSSNAPRVDAGFRTWTPKAECDAGAIVTTNQEDPA